MSARAQTLTRPRTAGPAAAPSRGRQHADLRLVKGGERVARGGRRRGRLVAGLVVAVAGGLLALVASQVVLTQGQFRLDRLQSRAAAEQARYERLRLQVAELEAPSRVVAVAQERLGMVSPPAVTYLSPSGPVSVHEGKRRRPESAATADWSRVKRELASQP